MTKARICILIGITAGIIFPGCNGRRLDSQWTSSKMTIDGATDDWSGLSRFKFDDENIIVGAANDDSNLYLMFRFSDAQLARSISRQGVTIWFNADGKKEETFGITYRNKLSAAFEQDGKPPMQQDEHNPNDGFQMLQEAAFEQLEVHDPAHDFPVHVRANGSGGPAASFAQEIGFTYEFAIPLRTDSSGFAIGTKPGETIRIGFKYGGMDPEQRMKMHEDRKEMGGPPGGGGGGGGMRPGGGMGPSGGMKPGGMGGPGRGGDRGDRKKATEPTEIWFKTVLAASPSS